MTHPRNAEYVKRYRERHPDKTRESTKEYRQRNAEKVKGWPSSIPDPVKKRARNAVNNAIRDGRLERQPCEQCGSEAQAHHEDYERPLDVRWLCVTCHTKMRSY